MKRNIPLFYFYSLLRSIEVTEAVWILFLLNKGISLTQIGLFELCYHMAHVLGEVPTGIVADRYGRRLSLFIGSAVSCLSAILIIVGQGPRMLGLAMTLSGLSWTFISGADQALLYDTCLELKAQERYMAIQANASSLGLMGMALGLFAGGWLANIGFTLPYLVKVGMTILGGVGALLLREPPRKSPGDETPSVWQLAKAGVACFRNDLARRPILFHVAFFTVSSLMSLYAQPFLNELGGSPGIIGTTLAVGCLVSAAATRLAPGLVRRWGATAVLVGAPILLGLMGVGLSLAGLAVAVVFVVLMYIPDLVVPILSDQLNAAVASSVRATVISLQSSLFSLLMSIGFLASGQLSQVTSLGTLYAVLGIITLLAGPPAAVWLMRSRKNAEAQILAQIGAEGE